MTGQELHNQIRYVPILADVMNRHDMIVWQFCSGSGFGQESLSRVFVFEPFGPDQLDSDLTIELKILRLEHDPHSTDAAHSK
jgi:hypothetical protein